jgi:uncharacterized protein (TIGR04255 family)
MLVIIIAPQIGYLGYGSFGNLIPVSSKRIVMAYKRPPITEAVIELRFARPFSEDVVAHATRILQAEYSYKDSEKGTTINFDAATGNSVVEPAWSGEKLSSGDRADITIFRTTAFVTSRLAPYLGWEQLRERSERAWAAWRKAAGSVELARIGVRYVNRIDIPTEGRIRLEDFLNFYPGIPDEPPIEAYIMQVIRPIGADDCRVTINSASTVSPLVGFASFLLDLDVYREVGLPRRDNALWELIDKFRHHKNNVFESCLTERTREIFDQ